MIEWERGTNRKIDANELIRCGRVSLESHWNKRKVRILFLEGEEENSVHYSMNLIGDIPELGSINGNFMKMKLINRKVFEKPESCWEYSFFVDVDIHHFYYSYVRFYRKKKQVVFGRMKYRQFVLQEATSETKARDMKNPIYLKYNCYIKVDDKMKTEIQVNQLDNTIFFGSYPQIQEDIDILHQRDIKHVVNLMSQREIYACLLDVPFFAKKCRISDINYLELDYDLTESVPERRERVITIAYKIHHLVMKSEPLYICEMDGFEKVQEVLSYLIKEHFPSRSYLLVQNKLLNPIEDLNLHTSSRSFEDIEF